MRACAFRVMYFDQVLGAVFLYAARDASRALLSPSQCSLSSYKSMTCGLLQSFVISRAAGVFVESKTFEWRPLRKVFREKSVENAVYRSDRGGDDTKGIPTVRSLFY